MQFLAWLKSFQKEILFAVTKEKIDFKFKNCDKIDC